ncbi:MAG: hypothetical protein ACRCTE_12710 [Cellulosilyticaceae bacterium]
MEIRIEELAVQNRKLYKEVLNTIKKKKKGLAKVFNTKITPEDAKELEYLSLKNIELENLNFLKYFPNLKELGLSDCGRLSDVSGLHYTKQMEWFTVYDTGIDNLSALEYCTELEVFEYMTIDRPEYKRSRFDEVRRLPKLWEVDLSGNNVEDVSFLATNPNLKEIVLCDNPVTNLISLNVLEKLTWLELERCDLDSLEGLDTFPALESLFIDENPIPEDELARFKSSELGKILK